MRIKKLPSNLQTPAIFTASCAQTPDKAELDRFSDRLAKENKAMDRWKTKAKTKDEMLAIIAQGKPVFEPGESTKYSDSVFCC
jgi:hypothetical protein